MGRPHGGNGPQGPPPVGVLANGPVGVGAAGTLPHGETLGFGLWRALTKITCFARNHLTLLTRKKNCLVSDGNRPFPSIRMLDGRWPDALIRSPRSKAQMSMPPRRHLGGNDSLCWGIDGRGVRHASPNPRRRVRPSRWRGACWQLAGPVAAAPASSRLRSPSGGVKTKYPRRSPSSSPSPAALAAKRPATDNYSALRA